MKERKARRGASTMKISLSERWKTMMKRTALTAFLIGLLAAAVFAIYRKQGEVLYREVRSMVVSLEGKGGSGRDTVYTFRGTDGTVYRLSGKPSTRLEVGSGCVIYRCVDLDGKPHFLLNKPEVYVPEETYRAGSSTADYRTYRAIVVTVQGKRMMGNRMRYHLIGADGTEYLIPAGDKRLVPGDMTTIYMLYHKDKTKSLQFDRPK